MIIYSGTIGDLYQDLLYNKLADNIESCFRKHGIMHNNPSERRAFNNSFNFVRNVLDISKISFDVKVAIEFKLPVSGGRVDFMLTGKDKNGQDSAVIVELKQWEEVKETDGEDILTYVGHGERIVTHPSYQAWGYATLIENYNEDVRLNHVKLHPCSYLHNFPINLDKANLLKGSKFDDLINRSPCFLRTDNGAMAKFINDHIASADDGRVLRLINEGKLLPSKMVQNSLKGILNGEGIFNLIDEQKVAYELILSVIKACREDGRKHVIFVKGGPGTGKSIVAMHLMAAMLQNGHNACYVTQNEAPRDYFYKILSQEGKKGVFAPLFLGPQSFYSVPDDQYDLVLVDEAHRIKKKSTFNKSSSLPTQTRAILDSSRVTVFFIDENQIVRNDDFGSIEYLQDEAEQVGAIVHQGEEFVLKTQFRCIGGNAYSDFIDNLLGIRPNEQKRLLGTDYKFRVFDDPAEMREAIKSLNTNNRSRLVAGFCYKWVTQNIDSRAKQSDLYDINIGDFHAKWNFKMDRDTVFALDEDSADRVGCIHTVQGLEFDYVGVIIGKDLYYEDGKVKTNYLVHPSGPGGDHSFDGLYHHQDDAKADRLVRNIYRVLMTRGQKGCFVYCEDPALRDYIRKKIGS